MAEARATKSAKEAPPLKRLLSFLGKRRILLIAGAVLAVFSTALGLVPYLIVYLIAEKVLGAEANVFQPCLIDIEKLFKNMTGKTALSHVFCNG